MARLFLFALALLCLGFTVTKALALGSDHPKGLIGGSSHWPEGLKDVVNQPERVHGYWVNETDMFYYDGDSKAFNQFIDGYSKLKNTSLRVVIHAGTEKARSPWDKAERDIPVAWSLLTTSNPLEPFSVQNPGPRFYTRVDVWLGSKVKLKELRIPAGLEVESAGEIEKFIAERQKQKK